MLKHMTIKRMLLLHQLYYFNIIIRWYTLLLHIASNITIYNTATNCIPFPYNAQYNDNFLGALNTSAWTCFQPLSSTPPLSNDILSSSNEYYQYIYNTLAISFCNALIKIIPTTPHKNKTIIKELPIEYQCIWCSKKP